MEPFPFDAENFNKSIIALHKEIYQIILCFVANLLKKITRIKKMYKAGDSHIQTKRSFYGSKSKDNEG